MIADLELERCIDSRIGVSGIEKGITSGEAKRLSFATEILTNPSLLFADEPTTGIDSFMAYHIIKVQITTIYFLLSISFFKFIFIYNMFN